MLNVLLHGKLRIIPLKAEEWLWMLLASEAGQKRPSSWERSPNSYFRERLDYTCNDSWAENALAGWRQGAPMSYHAIGLTWDVYWVVGVDHRGSHWVRVGGGESEKRKPLLFYKELQFICIGRVQDSWQCKQCHILLLLRTLLGSWRQTGVNA